MDYGAFLLFGCVALILLVYIPVLIFAYIRKSSKLRRHIFFAGGMAAFLLLLGALIWQVYVLDEPMAGAASAGDIKTVQCLLAQGASPDASGVDGASTALIEAAANGHTAVVQILLAKGADVDKTDYKGKTALQRATEKGHKDIVQILKKAGAK